MELHIYSAVKDYKNSRPKRFHMPGHKADKAFIRLFPSAGLDLTELEFSDNLDKPEGVIEKAQSDIAQILGAHKSFILTDGSSSGIFAMLKAVKPLGNKVIICRNSHKSVYNACEVLGIEPLVLNHNFKHNVMLPPSHEEIDNLLRKHSDIIGALITTPDYYGNCADLARISRTVRSHGKLLLVDGAHGSHLKFFNDAELYAGNFADIWVDGLHKTMPCLTQGALICTAAAELAAPLADALSYFRTSSPSYPVMASAEYAVKFMHAQGSALLTGLFFAVSEFKKRLIGKKFRFFKSEDYLKLTVDFKETGISTDLALNFLQERNIYPEFCDGRYIMFYLSALTPKSHLAHLESALKKLVRRKTFKNTYQSVPALKTGRANFSYLVAREMDKELCSLDDCEGRICAKNAGIFPPCVPLVVAGEIITGDTADILKNSRNVFGTQGKNIYVIK